MINHWDLRALTTDVATLVGGRAASEVPPPHMVMRVLETVATALEARYLDPKVVSVGGAGMVLRLRDDQLGSRDVALKLSLPETASERRLSRAVKSEVAKLAKLRHGSLIRLQGYQTLNAGSESEVSYFLSDWIEGSDSERYFLSHEVPEPRLIAYFKQVVDGLAYLHSHGVAHLDLKPSNILVADDGNAYIADLGSAKYVSSVDDDTTLLSATPRWADRELMTMFADTSTVASALRGVPRRAIRLRWDFAPLGRILLFWLNHDPFSRNGDPVGVVAPLREYTRRYLLLVAARLLGIDNVPSWLLDTVGISPRLLAELSYSDASEIFEDVQKLTGEYGIDNRVPELSEFPGSVIQVAGREPAAFTPRVKALVEHRAIGRLGSVTQLGIVSQVYPTATHSRLEHSLGTFQNACRIVRSLWLDPISPLFRQMVSEYDVCALLAASLLHDIGQYPLAHDLEEIAPKIFDHERLTRAILNDGAHDPGEGKPRAPIPAETLFEEASADAAPTLRDVLQEWGTTPERVIELLTAKPTIDRAPIRDRILHSLIDGPLDADKLDYLARDARRLGVPYGLAIDVDRIVRNLTVVVDERRLGRSVATIGVHEKGRVAAEFVGIARSAMFAQAYWHHTVRAMKAMLARGVNTLVVNRGLTDPSRRRGFIREFESFVLSPESTSSAFPATISSIFNPNDAAVLHWLHAALGGAPEAELLSDILERRYYRRLVVYSMEASEVHAVAERWDKLSPNQWLAAHRAIERRVLDKLDSRLSAGPTTEFLNSSTLSFARTRTFAGYPVLLIDVPARRSGSDAPLYYVRESSQRELRRQPRALSAFEQSPAWDRYGTGMRSAVGKLRIYAHPQCVDAMEAVADRASLLTILLESIAEAE